MMMLGARAVLAAVGVAILTSEVSGGSMPLRSPALAFSGEFSREGLKDPRRTDMKPEVQLFPSPDTIPYVKDVLSFYRKFKEGQDRKAMHRRGEVETSYFPPQGFDRDENVIQETVYVDGFVKWTGTRPADEPGMCFFLKKEEKTEKMQFVPIAPGPEGTRKLPMELAMRFDKVKNKPGKVFIANVRVECKSGGVTVANLPIAGKIVMEWD
ncbi:hypothetical protein T484DRAFT_1943583 [Baffinella frigidus]|nr:hypothetical protein T484DRAFT_1943583 [Cryptophyta sp. CCMP2293]